MVSATTLTIVFALGAAFCCLGLLEEQAAAAGTGNTHAFRGGSFARLAAANLRAAVILDFALALRLLAAHVRAIDRADAPAGGPLRRATLAAAVAALLAGAVQRLVAGGGGGHLGGTDDVGWPAKVQ